MNDNLQPGRPGGRESGRPARRPELTGMTRGFGRAIVYTAMLLSSLWGSLVPSASAGTVSNTAHLTFTYGDVLPPQTASNPVAFTIRTPAEIKFLKYAPNPGSTGSVPVHVPLTYYSDGNGLLVIPPPAPALAPTVPLLGTTAGAPPVNYYLGETLYLQLTDNDQNADDMTAENVTIVIRCAETGDEETLRLTETGPGTGIFAGYLPTTTDSAASGANGSLMVKEECRLLASYTDPLDLVQTVTDAALIDPYGIVFDSLTNLRISGVDITLMQLDGGSWRPATVFADDGITSYPATVTTGDTSRGFPAGGFRFPYVLPGTYRLDVRAPDGYTAPSSRRELVGTSTFAVVAEASFGESFPINPGPALHIDIPIDPLLNYLWLQKFVSEETASAGDFLQYQLELENLNATVTAPDVVLDDRLPLGFRYQSGSARIDGTRVVDPEISGDGRTLTFRTGALPPNGKVTITYVVEIAAGARAGIATNTAQANDGNGAASNQASRSITVRETFFSSKAFLIGRVLTGSCSEDDTAMSGLAGVRVYLEDGTYVVTDKDGRYHFEGVEPGTHVVQVDLATLPAGYEMIPCEQSSQSAGRAFSQFVDLRGGTLWRVNFYAAPKPPPTGMAGLALATKLDGRRATFSLDLTTQAVPLDNLRLTVMLPAGARFTQGTATRDGQAVEDPQAFDEAVTFRFPSLSADQRSVITFRADLSGTTASGELPAKALLTFDSPSAKNQRTPMAEVRFRGTADEQTSSEEIRLYPRFPSFIAELQETDLLMLKQLAKQLQAKRIVNINLVGHADAQEIAQRSQHIFRDNQALSLARAQSVADFLQTQLAIPAEAISVQGMGDTMPLADNATEAGRALNRRVELFVVGETISRTERLDIAQPQSPEQTVPTVGATVITKGTDSRPLAAPQAPEEPQIDQTWLATAQPAAILVWPPAGYAPSMPSTTINVQHQRGQKVSVTLNGQPVPAINLDGVHSRQDGLGVASWKGVDLVDGRNVIEAVVTAANGQTVGRESREIWYIDTPVRAEVLTDRSRLIADGISPPGIAVRLTDNEGHPVRPGMYVDVKIVPPYRGLLDNLERENPSMTQAAGKSRFRTGADGIVMINLEPTTQTGEAMVSIPLKDQTLDLSAWLKPAPRDWILVGFAEGTVGYNTISDNLVTAEDAGIDEHGYTDGRVKFFAKGAIKGEWLLTLAYDSDKPDLDGDSLQQIIDPDTYYPLYQDETRQGYEAASARDIYVKLERDQFYALFGDIQTGLTQTVLSQYSRSMNGFKSELQGERFSFTAFAADTKQAFVKDELRGDGTSGRYALSTNSLVINSESVVIETRDRFHSEVIVKEEPLSRHTDYDIDYDAGTLYFKRPVPSKDENFNPVYIVVRYETRSSNKTKLNYGGRGAVKLYDGKVEIGGSLVREENGVASGDLYGGDVTVKLTPQTTLHAEVATTDVKEMDADRQGDAYLAEVRHQDDKLDGRAWFRQQGSGFGLGQQSGGTNGMRTYGTEGTYRFAPRWSLAGELWHEDNLQTDARRDVGSVKALYRAERYSLSAGIREARDRFDDSAKNNSRQLLLGSDWSTPDRKLTLHANHEQSLGSHDENADFPTRTMLGADYRLTKNVNLFAEQEFTWGDRERTNGTRVGLRATPWQGGEVRSSVEQQIDESGRRVFALIGLGQSWQISKRWSIDLSLDRSQTIVDKPAAERVNPEAPPASGGDDNFTAVSVGGAYKTEKWSWWNRLETRQGAREDKIGVSSGIVGEVKKGTAVYAKLMAFITNSSGGRKRHEETVTLGMAYRPDRSRWILLEKLDLSLYKESGNGADNDGVRLVNHLHANFRSASRKWQGSFYYGLKYVRENFDGGRYDGYTDMLAVETRYNINARWDVGVHGAILHSWNSNQLAYSLGGDVGYLVTTNAWVSAGYNLVGFEDEDFSGANYTAQGPYVKLRMKIDQQSVKDAAEWLSR